VGARRVRMTAPGFDVPLVVEDCEPKSPGVGQVLVEVEACGVCHRDLIDRAGRFPWMQLPVTPGHEVAGRVVEVGDGVSQWAVGDRVGTLHRDCCGACDACSRGDTSLCAQAMWVFGLLVDGGYATQVLATESALYALPEDLPAKEACILHCTVGTAYRGLVVFGGLEQGQRALVVGANGGVGAAAVQVASRLGASVTAVIRSEERADFVREQGADKVVVDSGTRFHKKIGHPVDVAIDCVGSPTFNSSLRSLRMGGRLIAVGNVSEERAALNVGYAIVNGLQIIGSSGATQADMASVLALHRRAPLALSALVERTFDLSEAERAHAAIRGGRLRGRIVLENQQ
jgi:acryloyl-coenzyme A reductase